MLSVICNGCEKDPVSSGDKEHENASEQEVYGLSTIIVTCNDEKGRPLKEGRVALYPDNNTNFIKKQFTNRCRSGTWFEYNISFNTQVGCQRNYKSRGFGN